MPAVSAVVESMTSIDKAEPEKANGDDQEVACSIPQPPSDEISTIRELAFMFLMCMSQLLTQAGVAQTMVAATKIGESFHVADKPGEVSWFAAAYSLTVGTFILISGRLGDMYGYKLMYVVGHAWFGVFSLVSGFSGFTTSAVFFDVCRALQGMGPAITMPNTQAIIASYYPVGLRRNVCLGIFGAVAPGGFCFGAIFTAIFAQFSWWPWTFWTCGIVSIVLAASSILIVPKHIGNKQAKSFDWLGSVVGVSGLILLNFAWNQGPNVGWEKVYVYVLLIVGIVMLVAFVYVELHIATDPLIPRVAFRGETGFVLACIGCGWSCFGVWLYYQYRVGDLIEHESLIIQAVEFIPCGIVGVIAAIGTTFALRKFPSSFIMLMSMIAFFSGIVVGGLRHWGQTYWGQHFVSNILQPFGMDMSFPAGVIILSAAFPPAQQGVAGSLVSTVVNYSISIGLGIAGTVEYYKTKNMPEGLDRTKHGIRNAYYMGMGLAGLGVVVGAIFFVKQMIHRRRESKPTEATPDAEHP
ncbi:hypothetical protein DIURU_001582 [Diutina rugosa]|uniref:Major facilitator superfamily (MFS) profile domain-containing protein n=1 Tax=Diutina rugosa TaxID=5481 RepID=A0A642UTC0_DIURU|nr:uncharacterized protein DIURU_001582 [Diutina rugosa]KAA8905154.1 hypothetical protein DIURU_001582 [Diutina rugosa]